MCYTDIAKYTCKSLHASTQSNQLVQYVHAQRRHDLSSSLSLLPNIFFQLAGSINADEQALPSHLQRLVHSLTEENTLDPPPGAYCGCIVTPTVVWLFKTPSSNDTIFYV